MEKKKITIICAFLMLMLITAIVFIIAAVDSYNYDMDPANHVDILEGLGAGMLIILGGLIILCELDIFFTAYYFLIKPKTLSKSIFMTLSQLLLLLVFFSESLARFLSKFVSDIFREESIVIVPIFILYVILRIVCVTICFLEKEQSNTT